MPRVAQFLAGISVVAAAQASVDCSTSTCNSCVGTALTQVCVNYTAPPAPPTCAPCPITDPSCSVSVATNANASCYVCVPGIAIGTCLLTTVGVAPYVTAQSTVDAGLNLGLFGSTTVVTKIDSLASGDITGNAVVVLSGTTPIANLNVGANANVIFQVNDSVTVTTWSNNAGSVKVNNNGTTLVVGQLSVSGSKFSVWQDGAASVTLNNVDFPLRVAGSATLQVAGGKVRIGGSASTTSTVTGTGNLQLSGGVSVDGQIPQNVTIDVSASGKSAPLATIDVQTTLTISGDVKTSTSNGVISVNGNFILGSTTAKVDPRVVVNAGASLVINSATSLQAKAVDISADATLVIGAKAKRDKVYIEKIAKCAGKVQIQLDTTAAVFVNSSGATAAVGFTYSSSNNVAELVKCGVEVVDSANQKFTLTSKTSTSVGRRLLESSGTATWGSDSMTFQMDRTQPPANSAPVSFAVIPLVMTVFAGLVL